VSGLLLGWQHGDNGGRPDSGSIDTPALRAGATGVLSHTADDDELVGAINRRTRAGLSVRGRSVAGELGGGIFVEWPDGRPGVVTVFHGVVADARRVAGVVNELLAEGLPVPRHDLVVDLGDRVVFVQRRLPSGPARPLGPARVDAIAEINERFVDALARHPEVPPMSAWFRSAGSDGAALLEAVPEDDDRAREVVEEILRLLLQAPSDLLDGYDLVHVDLSAANVLFDEEDRATAVVDWNLGVYRGDRRLALVQTRFDREWFVQRPDADDTERAAARRLDEILSDRIAPHTLRLYWAHWLGHHLPRAFRSGASAIIDWQLTLAETRLH
jgi:hypothetical protein